MRVCPARKTCSSPDSRQKLQAFLTNSQSQFVITLEHFGKISFSRSLFWDSLTADNMQSSSSSPVHMLLACCCMSVWAVSASESLDQDPSAATRDHTCPIACLDCLANATPCPPIHAWKQKNNDSWGLSVVTPHMGCPCHLRVHPSRVALVILIETMRALC